MISLAKRAAAWAFSAADCLAVRAGEAFAPESRVSPGGDRGATGVGRQILTGLFLLLALWVGTASTAGAQTISQPIGGARTFAVTYFGTSFTATVTGTVTAIRVRPRVNQATVLYMYNAPNTGQLDGNGTPVSAQPVTLVDTGSNDSGFQTIT